MPAFLLGLLKYIPFVGGLFEKLTQDKSRTEELRAEKELVETKAFAKGRISPKYLLKYILVGLFTLFALAFVGHAVFPSAFPYSPMGDLRELLTLAGDILLADWW